MIGDGIVRHAAGWAADQDAPGLQWFDAVDLERNDGLVFGGIEHRAGAHLDDDIEIEHPVDHRLDDGGPGVHEADPPDAPSVHGQ